MSNSIHPLSQQYPIMEQFYTIQGEGFHQGRAAYFIRLGGCDVGCVWCDVKDSWDAAKHPLISAEEIITEAKKYPSKLIVITGGEPLMYDLHVLINGLHETGFEVNIETSGAHPMRGNADWICFFP
jgi:7-carboxy-7-deazaguanine synthase